MVVQMSNHIYLRVVFFWMENLQWQTKDNVPQK